MVVGISPYISSLPSCSPSLELVVIKSLDTKTCHTVLIIQLKKLKYCVY